MTSSEYFTNLLEADGFAAYAAMPPALGVQAPAPLAAVVHLPREELGNDKAEAEDADEERHTEEGILHKDFVTRRTEYA